VADIRPGSSLSVKSGGSGMGPGHTHSHPPAGPMSRGAVWFAVSVLVCTAALTVLAMIWLWPHGSQHKTQSNAKEPVQVSGEVLAVKKVPCPADSGSTGAASFNQACGAVAVRLTTGTDKGKTVTTNIPSGPGAPQVNTGDRITLSYTAGAADGLTYQIIDHQRGRQIWFLILAFALAVIAFGRWRGLAALAGLGVTFAVLLLFIVPAILDGRQPLLVAIVGAAAIMLSVLYLTHGFTVTTSVAVLGTLTSLILTGLMSALATTGTHLTGVGDEEAGFLSVINQNVDMRGLLLAGILIGSLGVLDDVTVTQAVTVGELASANRGMSTLLLYRAGARVGRAHITSVVNTIILAYAGASLPVLLLLAAGDAPLNQAITTQLLAQEIVRSVVGTLGLIAAVPITTGLAALAAKYMPGSQDEPVPRRHRRPTIAVRLRRLGRLSRLGQLRRRLARRDRPAAWRRTQSRVRHLRSHARTWRTDSRRTFFRGGAPESPDSRQESGTAGRSRRLP
jgi:uncharacterized membrane protein